METTIEFRRTRGVGDVLNDTFRFIQQNVRVLGKSLLFILGPVAAFATAGLTLVVLGLGPLIDEEVANPAMVGFGMIILFGFGLVLGLLPSLVVNSFVVLYQDYGPGAFGVPEVWAMARAKFWKILGAYLLLLLIGIVLGVIGLIPCLGTLVNLIGAIYVQVTFALVYPLLVREPTGIIDGFSRCVQLIKEHWWDTFGIVVLANLIYFIGIMGALMPGFLVMGFAGFSGLDLGEGSLLAGALILGGVLFFIVLVMLRAVPELAAAFQYFSLVEHKEHVGLRARVDALAAGLGPDDTVPPWLMGGADA